jgi:hypothetical protein
MQSIFPADLAALSTANKTAYLISYRAFVSILLFGAILPVLRGLISRTVSPSRADSHIARVSLVFLAAGSGVIGLATTPAQLLIGTLTANGRSIRLWVAVVGPVTYTLTRPPHRIAWRWLQRHVTSIRDHHHRADQDCSGL